LLGKNINSRLAQRGSEGDVTAVLGYRREHMKGREFLNAGDAIFHSFFYFAKAISILKCLAVFVNILLWELRLRSLKQVFFLIIDVRTTYTHID
jgi:hypothetical protein